MEESTDVSLQLECDDIPKSRLQDVTRDFVASLREQNLGSVKLESRTPGPGHKGDPVTIGAIIMTLIGSGGVAVKFIQVLRPYFARKPSLKIKLSRLEGKKVKKVEIDAESISESQLQVTSQMLNRFFAG